MHPSLFLSLCNLKLIPSNDDSFLGPRAKQPDTALSVTRNLRNLTAAAPLRTKFIYCNMMYTAATALVETKSGLGFAEYLDQRFFAPLGMTATNLQPARAREKGLGDRISPGHWWNKKEQKYDCFDLPDAPEAQGAGSIVTCVDDYIKYVKALMNKEGPFTEDVYDGLIRARTIISPDYEEVSPFSAPPMYAAGWEVHHYRGVRIVVHEGNICGSSSSHFFVPEYKFGAVMIGNTSFANLVSEILMQEMIDRVIGLPDDQRLNWDEVLVKKYDADARFGDEDTSYAEDEAAVDKQIAELRQKLCPAITEPEPQKMPLSAYTGEYWNPGWRGVTVQIKNESLFIDCSDRSYVFEMTLEHVCAQTKYIAHLKSAVFGQPFGQVQAEFRFANNVATRLGIWFEEDIDDYIWFERSS